MFDLFCAEFVCSFSVLHQVMTNIMARIWRHATPLALKDASNAEEQPPYRKIKHPNSNSRYCSYECASLAASGQQEHFVFKVVRK